MRSWLPSSSCGIRTRPVLISDRFKRLADDHVALRVHFVALLDAESLVEDFGLQTAADEVALERPIPDSGLDIALRKKNLELVEQFRRHLEIGADAGMPL